MTSEGSFCTDQQNGLMYYLGTRLVSSVITRRAMPCGGVGFCSQLPQENLYSLTMGQDLTLHLAPDI